LSIETSRDYLGWPLWWACLVLINLSVVPLGFAAMALTFESWVALFPFLGILFLANLGLFQTWYSLHWNDRRMFRLGMVPVALFIVGLALMVTGLLRKSGVSGGASGTLFFIVPIVCSAGLLIYQFIYRLRETRGETW